MTRAFITGISGQDGSYLADRLLGENAEVHGLIRSHDSDSQALLERHPAITLHVGDLSDSPTVAGLISEIQPTEVYNLAGISSVAQSWEMPVQTGIVTGVAVANLLKATFGLDIGARFLQASSSEMFGIPSETPQTESTTIQPTSPYGAAKAYAHTMTGIYRQRGLHAVSCILYNHESPRRPATFVTRKITAAAVAIAAGRQDVVELGNLDVRRDWGWAPDYVDAMVSAMRHDVADDFIVATGEAHTVAEFAEAAFAAVGITDWQPHVVVNPDFVRPAEIATMIGDSGKARRELGWSTTVGFEQIVARMVEADQQS